MLPSKPMEEVTSFPIAHYRVPFDRLIRLTSEHVSDELLTQLALDRAARIGSDSEQALDHIENCEDCAERYHQVFKASIPAEPFAIAI